MNAQHVDVRGNPVRQLLAPGRLGIGEAGGAEHRDEDLGAAISPVAPSITSMV
jgi:hypothetical protein